MQAKNSSNQVQSLDDQINHFSEIANRYGLLTPEQVKQRIIWNNLKAIVEKLYGPHPQNAQLIAQYEHEFRISEAEESR